jgi:hypothetical protein
MSLSRTTVQCTHVKKIVILSRVRQSINQEKYTVQIYKSKRVFFFFFCFFGKKKKGTKGN